MCQCKRKRVGGECPGRQVIDKFLQGQGPGGYARRFRPFSLPQLLVDVNGKTLPKPETSDLLRNLGLDFAPPPSYCTSDAADRVRSQDPDH